MVIKNQLSDPANSARHEHPSLSQEMAESPVDLAPEAADTDLTLEQALKALPEEDRELIVYRYIVGLKLGEIAELRGYSSQDARQRCQEIVEKLGSMLGVKNTEENL